MGRRLRRAVAIGIVAAGAAASIGRSQNVFERLVTPGPLIAGHAKLEKLCSECHEPFSRSSQTRLCLACHKEIATDRSKGERFHGHHPLARAQECNQCHTDHKGRDADIVQLDRETFNHAFTNFALREAHKVVGCAGCHAPTARFRDTPGRCFDCHRADDPHQGRLGEACGDCHAEAAWRLPRSFDHDKTRFPVRNAHRTIACTACHLGERYTGIGMECTDCHKIQDVHAGRYGTRCESCHDDTKWAKIRFNHGKATKFPLNAAHAQVRCDSCHTGDLYQDKLTTTCVSCHRKDDRHAGLLGNRCERCHREDSWRRAELFDHDVARFPLIGLHAVVSCEDCHRSLRFRDTSMTCASCHADRRHEGRLGRNCALCHNPNGWNRWRFDHTARTRFPLTGAHRGLDCQACHTTKNVATMALGTDCYGCHRGDDVHNGTFGRACERCHTTASFAQIGRRP